MTLENQIAAAKRALSIISKFAPGEYRAYHVSRIFKNLNRLRGLYVKSQKITTTLAGIAQ